MSAPQQPSVAGANGGEGEKGEAASAARAPPVKIGGWTFSSDTTPEKLAAIQGLIATNGLAVPTLAGDAAAAACAGAEGTGAEEAPSAAVQQVGSWTFSADLSPESLADIQGLIAANGIPVGGAGGGGGAGAVEGESECSAAEAAAAHKAAGDAAFARLMAANPGATVVGGEGEGASGRGGAGGVEGEGSAEEKAAAAAAAAAAHKAAGDAAFARLIAANPGAKVVGGD
jgi:hypothetical protein